MSEDPSSREELEKLRDQMAFQLAVRHLTIAAMTNAQATRALSLALLNIANGDPETAMQEIAEAAKSLTDNRDELAALSKMMDRLDRES